MEKYTLQMPQKTFDGWYVGVEENISMYLRPSIEILHSTGYYSEKNIGYWDTYEEALNAKAQYEGKK